MAEIPIYYEMQYPSKFHIRERSYPLIKHGCENDVYEFVRQLNEFLDKKMKFYTLNIILILVAYFGSLILLALKMKDWRLAPEVIYIPVIVFTIIILAYIFTRGLGMDDLVNKHQVILGSHYRIENKFNVYMFVGHRYNFSILSCVLTPIDTIMQDNVQQIQVVTNPYQPGLYSQPNNGLTRPLY